MQFTALPVTRRGIISAVNSIYDPLGFCAPVMLEAKLIQQELCRIETYEGAKLGWDDPIPPELEKRWMSWKTNLPILEKVEIPRCFQPQGFSRPTPVSAQLHHFGDASNLAYGCSSYLRLVDQNGQIHVSFVIGKSRVAPLKNISLPRKELTAAATTAEELPASSSLCNYPQLQEFFYSDSNIVLGYINNDSRSFKAFVACGLRLAWLTPSSIEVAPNSSHDFVLSSLS